MSRRTTSKPRRWTAARAAAARALCVAAASGTSFADRAMGQTSRTSPASAPAAAAIAVAGIAAADSRLAAEFAKDSIGGITGGVDRGTQAWWISLDPEGRVDLLRYQPIVPPK